MRKIISRISVLVSAALFSCLCVSAHPVYKFKRLNTSNVLPGNNIQKIYQGKDGYIWMASQNGLYQYDGYTVKVYKSNLYNPDLLTNNNIFCLEEDAEERLWIGTYRGLNVLDKKTGGIDRIDRREFVNNTVSTMLATKGGRLLVGTDRGLYDYDYAADSCRLLSNTGSGGFPPNTSIKSLMEDSYGHIWIGTWNRGLFRYEPESGKYHAYPRMNEPNSAHVIFEDSRKRIWVGTWGGGLQVLENAYDVENVSWTTYAMDENKSGGLPSNIIYGITEDLNNRKLWVGTNVGLSVLQDEKKGVFDNYLPGNSEHTISDSEVNAIIRDSQGLIWLGLLRGGVNVVNTRNPYFNSYTFDAVKSEMNTNSVAGLLMDDDGVLFLALGNRGMVTYDRKTNNYKYVWEIPGFSPITRMPSIISMAKLASNGQIWIGTYNTGLYVYDKTTPEKEKVKVYTPDDVPWLSGYQIYAICEDERNNRWIGTNYGLTVVEPDFNHYLRLDSLACDGKLLRSAVIVDIRTGGKDEVWAASGNNGIYRIKGSGRDVSAYTLSNYSTGNGKLNCTSVSCLHVDAKGRIWAGGVGGGLNLYDRETDAFIPVHLHWNLPGDAIYSMLEDEQGSLWMGTNSGLMKLDVQNGAEAVSYRLYTTADGLLDHSFTRKGAFKAPDGEMFFGTNLGLNSFYPKLILEEGHLQSPPVVISDIKIHNRTWNELPEAVRKDISPFTPEYAQKIRLNHKNNNFSIEFAALGYETPWQYTYAYKLEGFDEQWQYTGATRRFAYYNNLRSGTYRFLLKSTNANGVWSDEARCLQIEVLPPPWKTWWAYSLYLAAVMGMVVFVFRMMNNRLVLQHKLKLREIQRAKSEEMNHAKLQFFTNITHELLTPLTIISASVDELRRQAPQYAEVYKVMNININRLIRLLQQILEFRKAETGNLKLRVSHGDLAAFVTGSVESFRPLIKKKQLNCSVVCDPALFPAWFDPDKLDKILYNLLSNAAKYGKADGNIVVELKEDKLDKNAVITVADDGVGMSKEAQKDLFKRFYEGDYRKFKTIGTGIGLSLTRDLVILHGGEISVESEEGKGSVFRIVLPVSREVYKIDEVDDTYMIEAKQEEPDEKELKKVADDAGDREKERYHVLLVEDNEDLLQLMVRLLEVDYNIFTATNGDEAVKVIRQEEIHLVVSDIMMPIMDGVELCKWIKTNFDTSHVPVLLLTAKTGEADRVDAYESGADSFLNKPFNFSVLHARIDNLLNARERMNKDFKKQLVFEAKELNYTSIDEEFLQKAIDCVHKNLSDPNYDQTRFVKDMGTTRSTLFRKMKSLTGLSYVSFVRNIRLKAACRIMEEKKNIRISELAYAVGFNDPRYFSTCFKKEFGMQPREYFDRFIQNGNSGEFWAVDDDAHNG